MKFSIICPVYNNEEYIGLTVKSVLDQSHLEWELILINDGSTDGSLKKCFEYEGLDKRIKVINQKNAGALAARLAGIKASSGDYILFLDSDDCFLANALNTLNYYLSNCELLPDALSFNFLYDESSKHTNKYAFDKIQLFTDNKDILRFAFVENDIGNLCRYCIKKSIADTYFDLSGLGAIRYTEDALHIYKILCNANSLLIIPNQLYFYRTNRNSITNSINQNDKYSRFVIFNDIFSDLYFKGVFKKTNIANYSKIFWIPVSYLLHSYKDSYKVYKKRCKEIRKSFLVCCLLKTKFCKNKKAKIAFVLMKCRLHFLLRLFTKIIKYYES